MNRVNILTFFKYFTSPGFNSLRLIAIAFRPFTVPVHNMALHNLNSYRVIAGSILCVCAQGHQGGARHATFERDSQAFVTRSEDHAVRLWHLLVSGSVTEIAVFVGG